MRHIIAVIFCVFLAACASEPRHTAVVTGPARYASAEESARLRAQAAANFARERERQSMLAGRRLDLEAQPRRTPSRVTVRASALPPVLEGPSEQPAPRRRVTQAEARYAMQIGKSPFDLTPGERAVAVGY